MNEPLKDTKPEMLNLLTSQRTCNTSTMNALSTRRGMRITTCVHVFALGIGWIALPSGTVWCADKPLRIIPLVEVNEKEPGEALQLVLAEFRKAHPDASGYQGYLFCSDAARNKRISLQMANIPVEIAITAIANSLELNAVYIAGNVILIESHQVQETYFAGRLTDDVLKNLRLEKPVTPDSLIKALRKWGRIDLDDEVEIVFDEKQHYVRIRMILTEAQKLHALFELISRGLKIVE